MRAIWARLRRRLGGRRREEEIAEELRFHLDASEAELRAAGLPPPQARRRALERFGDPEAVRRACTAAHGALEAAGASEGLAASLRQDVLVAARGLARAPGFSAAAILTLALGVGANTAIFSAVNALLLRPLPYPDADRVVVATHRDSEGESWWTDYPLLRAWQRDAGSVAALSAMTSQTVNLTGREEPGRIRGGFVSASFFDVVGIEPAIGRGFRPGEDAPGAEPVCVLDHAAWRDRFGGDPGLLGSRLVLNDEPVTVVGVMPEGFGFPWGGVDVWLPVHRHPGFETDDGSDFGSVVVGRLRPDAPAERAAAELSAVAERWARDHAPDEAGTEIRLPRLQELAVGGLRPALLVLMAAVGLVLLVACSNVAGLALARTVSRQRELAVRRALGASTPRLLRQLLTEAALLGALGGAAGLPLGWYGARALAWARQADLPGGVSIEPDGTVLLFTAALSLLTGLTAGLAPALRLLREDTREALGAGARVAGPGRGRFGSGLVVVQVALTTVLLVASSLVLHSLLKLTRVEPGFRPEGLLTLEYRLPATRYPEDARQWQFHRSVVERVRRLPGVRAAAVVRALPFSGNGGWTSVSLPAGGGDESVGVQFNSAGPGYFEAMGIPLLRGRGFDERDDAGRPLVAVVNRFAAERLWPEGDAPGQVLRFEEVDLAAEVVGVVGDVKHRSLREPPEPQVYVAYAQNPSLFATLVVRAAGEPLALADDVRAAIWSLDDQQPVWKVRTAASLVERSTLDTRFLGALVGTWAGLALVLAVVGLYTVLAYGVRRRVPEIGLRMALGADGRDVVLAVVRRGLGLTALGLLAGGAAALASGRLLSSLLYAVDSSDPASFAAAGAVLLAAAALAAGLPARRAARVDPAVALRQE